MTMWNRFKRAVAKILNINVQTTGMNDESFAEWLGVRPKKTKVMNEVTYFTCLKMMSETMAKMPWKLYQRTDKGIVEPNNNETAQLMKVRPNPFMTPTTFWNTVEMNRCHFGNAYVYVRRRLKRKKYGGELKVMDMWIMPSNCVQVVVDDAGYFAGAGKIWYVYNDPYSGQQYIFGTDEVLHFKTSHSLDGITGLPVQYILKASVEGAAAAQDFMTNLYENGLTAKATLEYTGELNEEAKEKLIQAFEHYGAGTKNTGKILPVPLGMKLTPLDIKLSDAQFIELRKYSALQIAGAFGIKPNQINDYEKSSYSNSEMQQLSFYVDTMLFVMKQYEEEVDWKLLTDDERDQGLYFKLNEKVLLRTDSKTQMQIFAQGINNGVYKPNEARRKLDMTDEDGGDVLIVNGAYIPLMEVGKQYGTKTAAETAADTAQTAPDAPERAEGEEIQPGAENGEDGDGEGQKGGETGEDEEV
jgi:HK97 family phage portal protein